MNHLAKLDRKYVWHPFTQMRDWMKREPVVIVSGKGATLRDTKGRTYLDANSSIWTNLHGHNHPQINRAIEKQLRRIAHSSALGLANEPASLLAEKLVHAARPRGGQGKPLSKVFFSDDGSTAMEVALKLAYAFVRRSGISERPRFLSMAGAYHGDTIGAVSLGHIDLFHSAYSGLLFKTDKAASPYCYRCRFNRAKPERADARDYRKCNWECLGQLEKQFATAKKKGKPYAGFIFEPLIQGAAGMVPQPADWLSQAAGIARCHGALLIADEVLTGFGRTGTGYRSAVQVEPPLFACQQERVQPDFLALAKGMTGGYLPMAATLTTQAVFDAFLGKYEEFKTFFHGHSYTANQLGAAAALANLELLSESRSIKSRSKLEKGLEKQLQRLWDIPQVGDIRRVGLIAGVELVRNWRTRKPFELREQAGIRVCQRMAEKGVLTRPIGNVVVLMPPYCTTAEELDKMVTALRLAISEVL